ncbi:heparan-alpha-glucosaminide N-acetyltransferase-like [Anomaloglossus baeobatrachus]
MAIGIIASIVLCSLYYSTAIELRYDEALLTVNNHLLEPITLLYVSDYCYKCLLQPLMALPAAQSLQSTNNTVIVSTHFALTFQVVREGGNEEPVCSWKQLYGEHGDYIISVQSTNGTVQCYSLVSRSPSNSFLRKCV